jgi:hypothetical protein
VTGPTRTVRAEVIRRDGGMCVVTGRQVVDPETLVPFVQYSLQHRRARGAGGSKDPVTNSPANLVLVEGTGTTGAHGRIESQREWARRLGYAVPQWQDPATVPVFHRVHGWAWIRPEGWVPLTRDELWLQAAERLADDARGLSEDDPAYTRMSMEITALFGLLAEEAA